MAAARGRRSPTVPNFAPRSPTAEAAVGDRSFAQLERQSSAVAGIQFVTLTLRRSFAILQQGLAMLQQSCDLHRLLQCIACSNCNIGGRMPGPLSQCFTVRWNEEPIS